MTEQLPPEECGGPAAEPAPAAPAPAPADPGNNLKLRMITATVYVAVLLGFFALKIFVSDLFFDALILLFSLVGTYEMLRAFKDQLHLSQKIIVMIFAGLVIAAYAVSDFVFAEILGVRLPDEPGFTGAVGRNYAPHITFVVFTAGVAALCALLVFAHERVSLESTGYALLSYLYPSFFLVVLTVCNHLERYSELALMLVFVIAPCADVFAFVFGRSLGKKLPAKLAPHVSPKKTLIGGLGGLIGGMLGGGIVYLLAGFGMSALADAGLIKGFEWTWNTGALGAFDIVFYLGLGVLTAAFSQFGDLVESAIKRKLGIKDMGKILPGHGGILDRIDSALYAGLIVCFVLVIRIMIVG